MNTLVTGEWVRELDGKARLAIPTAAAAVMRLAPDRPVMVGRLPRQVLAVLTLEAFEERLRKADQVGDRDSRRYMLAFFHRVFPSGECHRVTLPHTLREYADLRAHSTAYVVGCGNGLRVMSAEAWVRELAELEAVAQAPTFDLPRGIQPHPQWRALAERHRLLPQRAPSAVLAAG